MSTTTELKVAAEFAASGVGGKIGVVYEMQMGMIDRYVCMVYLVHRFLSIEFTGGLTFLS